MLDCIKNITETNSKQANYKQAREIEIPSNSNSRIELGTIQDPSLTKFPTRANIPAVINLTCQEDNKNDRKTHGTWIKDAIMMQKQKGNTGSGSIGARRDTTSSIRSILCRHGPDRLIPDLHQANLRRSLLPSPHVKY